MTDVLADYASLYRAAFADVGAPLMQKEANPLARGMNWFVNKASRGGAGSFLGDIGDGAQAVKRVDDAAAASKAAPQKAVQDASNAADDAARKADDAARKADDAARKADDATQKAPAGAPPNANAADDATEEVVEEAGRSGIGYLPAALGAGAIGGGAYGLGRYQGQEIGEKNRNLAFGAGMATGAVAPKLMERASGVLNSIGGSGRPPSRPQMGYY